NTNEKPSHNDTKRLTGAAPRVDDIAPMMALDVQTTREAFREHEKGGPSTQVAHEPLHVLAATDGRPQSDHALLAARRLDAAGTLGVLTVVSRPPEVAGDPAPDDHERIALRCRVDWQLRRVLGNDSKTR